MTKEQLIELAKQAGLFTHKEVQPEITRFATLVRNAALEEAAQAAVDAVAFNGGTVQTESHVRQAIESLKDPTP